MLGDAFLKPEEALESWDIRPGDTIADFGCGAGFFSLPMATRVGPQGKIYAIDVRPEALSSARSKLKLFHASWVDLIRADLEKENGTGLKDESVDKVLITNILFQVESKKAVIAEANRIIRPDGSIFVIEWDPEKEVEGPVLPDILNKKETVRLMAEQGFAVHKECAAGSHHYGLIFKKQPR
jgi:ubiquinone/menaquinone biosynthesis C-methylase UbiE